MWVSKVEYRTLVQQAALVVQLEQRLTDAKAAIADLKHELEMEKGRANAAVDAMLVKNGAFPVTPTQVPDPNTLFDEDPDELARITQQIAERGPLSVLDEAK